MKDHIYHQIKHAERQYPGLKEKWGPNIGCDFEFVENEVAKFLEEDSKDQKPQFYKIKDWMKFKRVLEYIDYINGTHPK